MMQSYQESEEHKRALNKAVKEALRTHFTGPGSKVRTVRFLGSTLLSSAEWFAKLVCLVSWAAVAAVLVGPDHSSLLAQFHSWMVATPLDRVLARSEWILHFMAIELAKLSLLLGLMREIRRVIRPAVSKVKQRLKTTVTTK
jgi:hypothetical protein